MSRLDSRTEEEFKVDIRDTTLFENHVFKSWYRAEGTPVHGLKGFSYNSLGRGGEFIDHGVDTSGADFTVVHPTLGVIPLEVKFSPNPNFFTLKIHDIDAYIKEGATILVVQNTNLSKSASLKHASGHAVEERCKVFDESFEGMTFMLLSPSMQKLLLESPDAERVLWNGKHSVRVWENRMGQFSKTVFA